MIIPSGFAQANWVFTGSGAPNGAEFTIGLDVLGIEDDPLSIAETCAAAWGTTISTFQSSAVTLSSVRVKSGPNDLGPFAEFAVGTSGDGSGVAFTPQVSLLVTKVTASGGRANRGRFFIPGISEATADPSGDIASADLTYAQAALDDFYDILTTDLAGVVVLHGEESPVTIPTPVTSFQVQSKVATQRRRLRP